MSLWLSILGGVLLTAAAAVLVSISLGTVGGGRLTYPDGTTVAIPERRTASILEDSPGVALGWIAAALGVAVIATLLTRYGGTIGASLVFVFMGLVVLLSIPVRIGIYIMPGAGFLEASALITFVARLDPATSPASDAQPRRSRRR